MNARLRHRDAVAAALLFVCAQAAHAQPCTPSFSTRVAAADINNTVNTLLSFNDGSGAALYAGGTFTVASSATVNRIAKWTLDGWKPLGSGVNSTVNAVIVFDAGDGPRLYAAGAFTQAGTLTRNRIARWDGSTWAELGTGLNNTVNALAVFDEDGPGPGAAKLYAGGAFTTAGGIAAQRIARWDGAAWSPVGSGCDGTVNDLHVHSAAGGDVLYIGGTFANAGGIASANIASWNGSSYGALAGGTTGAVNAITSFDADGPAGAAANVIIAGAFLTVGGISANRVAAWDGSAWFELGGGVNNTVQTLMAYDDGSGEQLYAGGTFTAAGGAAVGRLARWNGSVWSAANTTGFDSTVQTLVAHNDGRGPRLIAAGSFGTADGSAAQRVAGYDGARWACLDRGTNGAVDVVAVHDAGSGAAIYMGGAFDRVDGMEANQIVRYQHGVFTPLGNGIDNGNVSAMATFNEASGPNLFVGGSFTLVQGVTTNRIARWNGTAWSAVQVGSANGTNGAVNSLLVWNDGGGPRLYAGGAFTTAGGASINRVAKWDGAAWAPLGTGVNNTVYALATYNDGTGAALYAAGSFTTAGGATANRIARWNGSSWSEVGGGLNNTVNALAVYGGELYAAGTFSLAGSTSVNRVARWNGSMWADVGAGVNNTVNAMAVFDENGAAPGGEVLFVGGLFTTAGGATTVNRVARWDGASWSALGTAVSPGASNTVNALAAINAGPNSGLYIGGAFLEAGGQTSARLAIWGCPPCYANCDSSTIIPILNVADFSCFLQRFAAGDVYANCDGSAIPPVLNVADFSCFLTKFAQGCP